MRNFDPGSHKSFARQGQEFWSRFRANSSSSHRGLHGRRRDDRLGFRKRNRAGVSTIYVDRLQIGVTADEIHEIFKVFGRIQEIHIAKKRRRHTNYNFGFVKFLQVEDALEAWNRTKGLPVKGVKIFVDWAKFDWKSSKATPRWRRVNQVWRPIRKGTDNLNPCDKELSGKEPSILNKNCPEVKQIKSIEGKVCDENLLWLSNSLVVESCNPIAFESMCSLLLNSWRSIVKIRSLGQFKLLLTFESSEDVDAVLDSGRDLLLEHFVEVRKWSIHDRCQSRRVWLEIVGVPAHAWCRDNFLKIGKMWGGVVCVDNGSIETLDLSSGKVLIDTFHLSFIQDNCYLVVGDCGFDVNVKELGSYFPFKVCHGIQRPDLSSGSDSSNSLGDGKTVDGLLGDVRDLEGARPEGVGEEQAHGGVPENVRNLETIDLDMMSPNVAPQHSYLEPRQDCDENNVLEETLKENVVLNLSSDSSRTALAPVNYGYSDEIAVLSQLCNNKDKEPPGFEQADNCTDLQNGKEVGIVALKTPKRKGRNFTRRRKKNFGAHGAELDALLDNYVAMSKSDEESIDDMEEAKKTWSIGKALGLMANDDNEVIQALSKVRRSARLAKKKSSLA